MKVSPSTHGARSSSGTGRGRDRPVSGFVPVPAAPQHQLFRGTQLCAAPRFRSHQTRPPQFSQHPVFRFTAVLHNRILPPPAPNWAQRSRPSSSFTLCAGGFWLLSFLVSWDQLAAPPRSLRPCPGVGRHDSFGSPTPTFTWPPSYMVPRVLYFVPGDRQRLDCVRAAQPLLTHPDERFMLDAPTPAFAPHRSVTADPNVNDVLSGFADHEGRRWPLFFKPLSGVKPAAAHLYRQDSPVDVGIHEVAAWWLARELGSPWSELVAPAVWFDPPNAKDIRSSGPVILGMGGSALLPEPGVGFDRLIS